MYENAREKINLLLVEDDEDFSHALAARLTKRNIEVTPANTAENGLEKYKKNTFDVIVVDIKLPGMDGIEFLSRVRKLDKDIPVIVVTGYASLESAKEAVKLKAADYLLKPLDSIEELLDPIYKAIHGYKLTLENRKLMNDLLVKISVLEKADRRCRELFESAGDSIFELDPGGIIKEANRQAEEITKNDKEELIGKNFRDIVVPVKEKDRATCFRDEVMTGKYVDMMEVKIDCGDEGVRLGEMSMRPIRENGDITGIQCIIHEITDRKKIEDALKESENRLQEQKVSLEQKNIALREILGQIEVEKRRMKEDIIANVDELLLPALKKLRRKALSHEIKYIDVIQHNLEELVSSFGRKITDRTLNLTPSEIKICNMIKSGLTSKEIAKVLNISLQTVERHRNNIRKKLDIVNKDINLITYLQML